MGRRAKKQKVQTKKRPEVAKKFKCPFCNHEDSVECKMKMAEGIGSLACRVCGAAYKMHISYLSEPIDVFYEWLDDCEKAAQEDDGRAETVISTNNNPVSSGNNNSISLQNGGDSDAEEERELLAAGYTKEELKKADEKEKGQKRSAPDLGFSDSDDDE